jgi:GDP-4-dehydro-6-deoxy-D-mannose reductase
MRCLITGINGFAASHLADHLLKNGHEVIGTHRLRARMDNVAHIIEQITLAPMELNDSYGVFHTIAKFQPSVIFHLAAQSFVGWSWQFPEETLRTNVFGTLHILEAVKTHVPTARVHIASSSQVYGAIPEREQPMGLQTRFNPMNPYDTSKLAQDMLALQYFNSYGLNIIRTRAFNISGPRRGESFAESSWAKQIAELEKRGGGTIKHGNLESYRDYVDVRDVVKEYADLALTGQPGQLYILGSGQPVKMQAILSTLVSLSSSPITLEIDPARLRPSDTPYMQAGDSILVPSYTIYETLKDLLNYWRERV